MNEPQRETAQRRIPADPTEGPNAIDFQRIFEASATPCLALWPNLTVAAASDSYLAIVMKSREAIIGSPLFALFPDELSPQNAAGLSATQASLAKVLTTHAPHAMGLHSYNVRRPAREGGGYIQRFWRPVNTPVLDAQGELLYILHQVEDVTVVAREQIRRQEEERVNAELSVRTAEVEALRQADALKDQFLGILSHELRTPINAIMGFGSILDDELGGALNADQHAYVDRIMGGADTMLALVNDLLDMSRMQAGKFSLNPGECALAPLIENVIANLAPAIHRKGHRLVTHLAKDLPVLCGDEQRIMQVMSNLLGNAIKFTPKGGTLTIEATRQDGHVRVAMSDTGAGIAPSDMSKLFQPFSQLDMTNTRKVGGTGLGLSICKALIEAHGGRIGVESEVGRGTTFYFELPVMPQLT